MIKSSVNVEQLISDRWDHSCWANLASLYEKESSINLSRYLFTVLQLIILIWCMENSGSCKLRLVFQRQHGDLGCRDLLDREGQRTNLYVMKCFEAFGFEDPVTFSESEMLTLSLYSFSRMNIIFGYLPWSWKSHINKCLKARFIESISFWIPHLKLF